MTFRVSPKDFLIFVVFCIFLLYISAIGVLNFSTFSNSGLWYGLNPIKAFSAEYILPTFVVFIILLVLIFTSVSSYIFDRDKKSKKIGINFKEKEESGYSRWAKDKEIKAAPHIEKVLLDSETATAAGVPLMSNDKELYVDNGENHTLVIGATASGKTTAIVDPLVYSLGKKGESMVITDPKGEIYKNHSKYLLDKGYNVLVLNFRDPTYGSAWNPLTLPYKLYKEGSFDKATELLEDIANNILIDPKNPGDPFWERNASDYFSGIALGLFEDAKDESVVNLNSIGYMATIGDESFAGASTYLNEYFKLKGKDSSPYTFASSVINAPSETKGGVVSVFRQKIRLFSSRENLSEMLSHSDFDMRDIGKAKTALFLIIHDEKTTYHALATIFIKQCYETLIDCAYKEANGKLPFRTNFILDEFANMPPLKDVTSMVTAARSRDVRFTFIVQNFAQLDDVYGKEDAQTIRSNCGNLIYLITTELAALEEISKLCGEVKSKEKEKTASVPLITVSDLQKLKMNEVIIIRARQNPFKTKLVPSYEMNWFKNSQKNEFYNRSQGKIELFDVKEYVKEEKRKSLFNALEQDSKISNSNPFMGMPSSEEQIVRKPFSFDELAKKIDERIAQEKAKHAQMQEKKEPNAIPNIPHFNVYDETPKALDSEPKLETKEIKSEIKENEQAPKVNIDKESVVVNDNNIVTDDEFFDDFFGDD